MVSSASGLCALAPLPVPPPPILHRGREGSPEISTSRQATASPLSPPGARAWPPTTITQRWGFYLQYRLLRKCRASWRSHLSPPLSPQRRPGSLMGKLLFREVHSPVPGCSVGVLRTLRLSPGLQQLDHLRLGSPSHEEAAWWSSAWQSQRRAPVLSGHHQPLGSSEAPTPGSLGRLQPAEAPEFFFIQTAKHHKRS